MTAQRLAFLFHEELERDGWGDIEWETVSSVARDFDQPGQMSDDAKRITSEGS